MEPKNSKDIGSKELLYEVWNRGQDVNVLGVFNIRTKHDLKRHLNAYANILACGIGNRADNIVAIYTELSRLNHLFQQ